MHQVKTDGSAGVQEGQSIGTNELERVVGVLDNIDANHIEARTVIPDRSTASTTEQIEQNRTTHAATSNPEA